jgi:hypothetical protein
MDDNQVPKIVPLAYLESHGFTRDDVRRRCPMAAEYGSLAEPYYLGEDLADLFKRQGGAAS